MTEYAYDWTEHNNLAAHIALHTGIQPEHVDDVVQDTMIKLTTKYPDGPIEGLTASTMVTVTTKSKAVDFIRKEANQKKFTAKYAEETNTYHQGEPLSKDVSPETRAIERDLVQKAMATLTDEQRQSVYLVDVMGYTYQEAADQAGISKQSFHRRHTRARAAVQRWRDQCTS